MIQTGVNRCTWYELKSLYYIQFKINHAQLTDLAEIKTLKVVKLQSSVANCERYNPIKFADFVYSCIAHRKLIREYREKDTQFNL